MWGIQIHVGPVLDLVLMSTDVSCHSSGVVTRPSIVCFSTGCEVEWQLTWDMVKQTPLGVSSQGHYSTAAGFMDAGGITDWSFPLPVITSYCCLLCPTLYMYMPGWLVLHCSNKYPWLLCLRLKTALCPYHSVYITFGQYLGCDHFKLLYYSINFIFSQSLLSSIFFSLRFPSCHSYY